MIETLLAAGLLSVSIGLIGLQRQVQALRDRVEDQEQWILDRVNDIVGILESQSRSMDKLSDNVERLVAGFGRWQ